VLLVVFVASVVALNWGRWSGCGVEGFRLYVTHPLMQTTLWDFAWVLAIVTLFIHQDARRHGLRYWYVLATYPVMPTVGLLLYIWLRHRKLSREASDPTPGA
jgi:hypothetical protein